MPAPVEWPRAWLGLGSNLGDSASILRSAVASLETLDGVYIEAISPIYRSAAIGPGTQADYLNGVIRVRTELTPEALLQQLLKIEAMHGRQRRERWAARTLDLDLLLYEGETRQDERLSLPHPRLAERNFVVCPLAALDPELALPGGSSASARCRELGNVGLVRLADFRF